MSIRDEFTSKVDRFQQRTGISDWLFSKEAIGDHNWLGRLRKGEGVSLTSIEKAEKYIESNNGDKAA